jgi:biotin carboxylase
MYSGDLNATIAELRKYPIACVFPGCENGIVLADTLSEALGLATNGTEKTQARKDKFLMMEELKKKDIPHPKSLISNSLNEIFTFARTECGFPIVLKPKDSAGTDNVFLCRNKAEAEYAFSQIVGQRNKMTELTNTDVVAQEYLAGTEYVVDVVSLDGKHYPAAFWKYRKFQQYSGSFVYDTMELLPSEGEVQKILFDYTCQVLDSLGVRYGATHNEMILTQSGPKLVEVNARLCGAFAPAIVNGAVGYGQAELMVDAYLDQEAFYKKVAQPYVLKKKAIRPFLISHQEGIIEDFPALPQIQALPSFFAIRGRYSIGGTIRKTVDLFTNPGVVDLVHEDEEVIVRDYQTLRALEKDGMFRVRPL